MFRIPRWYKYSEFVRKYAQFCKPGVGNERPSWLSGTGHDQRFKREMEGIGRVALGIRVEAVRGAARSCARNQRKSSDFAIARAGDGRNCAPHKQPLVPPQVT